MDNVTQRDSSALQNAPGIEIIIDGFQSVFPLRLLWGEIRGHEKIPLPRKIIVAWWQWSTISRLRHPRTPNVFQYKLVLDGRAMEDEVMELIMYGSSVKAILFSIWYGLQCPFRS